MPYLLCSSGICNVCENSFFLLKVAEACLLTRQMNGGLIKLQDLLRLVTERRRRANSLAPPISMDDLVRAIQKLKSLGQGFQVVTAVGQQFVQASRFVAS